MEIERLKSFVIAAEMENFRRAASMRAVSQPVLSRHIATLEEELGVLLFERKKQRVTLTPAGRVFVTHARMVLEQVQAGRQAMSAWKTGLAGVLTIGCIEPLATSMLPALCSAFQHYAPGVQLQIDVQGARALFPRVEGGDLDLALLGVAREDMPATPGVIMQELFRDRLHVMVPPTHAFAIARQGVMVADVAQQPLVLLDAGFGIRRVIERVFTQRGFPVRPVVEINLIESVVELVRHGVGTSVMLPRLMRRTYEDEHIVFIPVIDMIEEFTIGLLYRRDAALSVATEAFIRLAANAGT